MLDTLEMRYVQCHIQTEDKTNEALNKHSDRSAEIDPKIMQFVLPHVQHSYFFKIA